jgi:hypothetical protein
MQASVFAKALRLKRSLVNSGEVVGALCPRYLPPDLEAGGRSGHGGREVSSDSLVLLGEWRC